jgi:hypothetical protein
MERVPNLGVASDFLGIAINPSQLSRCEDRAAGHEDNLPEQRV